MTKKTNSLILRYGVSNLWKNKNTLDKIFSNILQLEKLIFYWLKKKGLNLFLIKYRYSIIYIFVYNNTFLDQNLKTSLLKYYRTTSNLKKCTKKFSIEKTKLMLLLSIAGKKNTKQNKKYSVKKSRGSFYFLLLNLHFKKCLNRFLLLKIRALSLIKRTLIKFLVFFLKTLINIFFFKRYIKIKNSVKIKRLLKTKKRIKTRRRVNNKKWIKPRCSVYLKKLRRINGFFKLKVISKNLESLIFRLKYQYNGIKINNIFFNRGTDKIPLFGKQIKKPNFRFKFFTVFLAISYTQSNLLGCYISGLIKKVKQHRKALQIFTDFFENFFKTKILILLGFQLRVTGKLGGKLRKSKYHYKIGITRLQTIKYLVSYCCIPTYTKYGVISVKIWLLQKNEKKIF